jgi:hypothetical protein
MAQDEGLRVRRAKISRLHSAVFGGLGSPRGRFGALPCVVVAAAAVELNFDMAFSTPELSTALTTSAASATATCASAA